MCLMQVLGARVFDLAGVMGLYMPCRVSDSQITSFGQKRSRNVQISNERKYHDCISMEEYLERRRQKLEGNKEKEERTKLAIQQGDVTGWSELFYT